MRRSDFRSWLWTPLFFLCLALRLICVVAGIVVRTLEELARAAEEACERRILGRR